ncbi:MAG TPA: hypothetical protein VFN71_00695 [Methylomirabilota bacterium]|nr:hypothetical protein [Methylomirabilota bacterium]
MRPRRAVRRSLLPLTALALLALAGDGAWGAPVVHFDPPPKDHHSGIAGAQVPIYDDEFGRLMKDFLITDGKSNVLDAKFLFGTCFGGGMLQGLKDNLDETVQWVGAGASRFDQFSFGQRTKEENDRKKPQSSDLLVRDRPHGFFTGQLLKQFAANPNQTLLDSINGAFKADEFGSIKNDQKVKDFLNGPGKIGDTAPTLEVGQSVVGNKGEDITLKGGDSHHAILWVGRPTARRDVNDVEDMRAALVNAWGEPDPAKNPGVTITIHFGAGKDDPRVPQAWKDKGWNIQPATEDSLKATLAALKPKLGPKEEFFFFAADHGDYRKDMMDQPRGLAPGASDLEALELTSDALWALLADPGNVPVLHLEYSGLTAPVPVYFNDFFLGDLLPSSSVADFTIPEFLLGLSNAVRIDNTSPDSFTLLAKVFESGDVGDWDVSVPAPSALALVVAGGLALLARTRRRA